MLSSSWCLPVSAAASLTALLRMLTPRSVSAPGRTRRGSFPWAIERVARWRPRPRARPTDARRPHPVTGRQAGGAYRRVEPAPPAARVWRDVAIAPNTIGTATKNASHHVSVLTNNPIPAPRAAKPSRDAATRYNPVPWIRPLKPRTTAAADATNPQANTTTPVTRTPSNPGRAAAGVRLDQPCADLGAFEPGPAWRADRGTHGGDGGR